MERNEDIFITNKNLKEVVNKLQSMGYTYIVKAKDKFLSNWGEAKGKGHIQLIACKDTYELQKVKSDLYNDNTFSYIDYNFIENYKSIYNWVKGKSWTITNSWARAFK